jgi:hypothetical protein
MEEITKEWPTKFLVPFEQIEISNADIIRITLVTQMEWDELSSAKKKKKNE